MHMVRTALLLLAALGAQSASATCYFVYSKNHQLLYRSMVAPVDLALPLHETVSALGPELALVFTASHDSCDGTLNMLESYRSSMAASKVVRRTR